MARTAPHGEVAAEQRDQRSTRRSRSNGSAPTARAISMNSSTSTRRSPASIFQTKELDRFNLAVSCRCVMPAACRASTIAATSARCLPLRSCFKDPLPKWSGINIAGLSCLHFGCTLRCATGATVLDAYAELRRCCGGSACLPGATRRDGRRRWRLAYDSAKTPKRCHSDPDGSLPPAGVRAANWPTLRRAAPRSEASDGRRRLR
jgi:hypothetical protein